MKKIINPHMTLLAVAVMQPASAAEVRGFLSRLFSESGRLPAVAEFSDFLEKQEREKRVLKVREKNGPMYVLTVAGSYYLSQQQRLVRDKLRMYLLRDARQARFWQSRGDSDVELAGVSPAVDTSSSVKGRAANKLGRRQASGRAYWPRIQEQFIKKTGLSRTPRDTFPSLISFYDKTQAIVAGYENFKFDHFGIGICLGVSPQLIWRMTVDNDRYYRSFTLPKKGGGERIIESPKVFLKVVQTFLLDSLFDGFLVHENVHSFSRGRSIATNAFGHVGKAFVGNVDIRDFFGSVRRLDVLELLLRHGFRAEEAETISKLCTKQDRLPQGAPTSPAISNAILYYFDEAVTRYCLDRNLSYSRYADDITVSGDRKEAVSEALLFVQSQLRLRNRLELNESKTRISSRGGQQRVTGVVVNVSPSPPRKTVRRIRAAFHRAEKQKKLDAGKLSELNGYLGFLKVFPKYRGSEHISRYERIVNGLRMR